jgi:acyl carrier protein
MKKNLFVLNTIKIWVKKKTGFNINTDNHLLHDRILDSLAISEFIIFCEKEFKVKFKKKDLLNNNFGNVDYIINLIHEKKI